VEMQVIWQEDVRAEVSQKSFVEGSFLSSVEWYFWNGEWYFVVEVFELCS